MTSKADLSLSVFTNEHYKKHKNIPIVPFDDLEINKSYFKKL